MFKLLIRQLKSEAWDLACPGKSAKDAQSEFHCLVATAILATVVFVAFPDIVSASGGMVGACNDCHTMHNSVQGQAVARVGLNGTITTTPLENLLRMDCIACHAQNGFDNVVELPGGSKVPQVYHQDSTDLAGGNFRYVDSMGSNRKGHNVIDLFSGGDDNAGPTYSVNSTYDQFTCAGSVGCHGTRSQLLTGQTIDNVFIGTKRTGLAAISGAHHNSYDGAKNGENYPDDGNAIHDGKRVADGYRFIVGLKGYGNEAARWTNVDENSHNEYYGGDPSLTKLESGLTGCTTCHIQGNEDGLNSYLTLNSSLKVPNNSMSAFCTTCHGKFHSAGATGDDFENNGVSGAFLRHPTDYVIPNKGEFAAYTVYDLKAPVARPTLYTASNNTVTPGSDLVMCLSCHVAHGSQYDSKLRFDYQAMIAGGYTDISTARAIGGCLACHTSKGVPPENR